MTAFNEYTEHLKKGSVPTLGMLCWYSVPEAATIQHSRYVVLIETSEAPVRIPELPKSGDVFRRACNGAKVLKVPGATAGISYNFTLRDAGYDDTFVFRNLVREHVDGKKHDHDYDVLAAFQFNKDTWEVKVTPTPSTVDCLPMVEQIADTVRAYVKQNGELIPSIAVRQGAQRAIEGPLYGTRVRPGGGVYFVAMSQAEKLEALNYVVNSVGNGASFHILPLVDDKKQRKMLKESFEDESVEQTSELISEIADLLSSDKVTARKFEDINSRYVQQKARLSTYQGLLTDALDKAQTQLEVCNAQLIALLDKAT